jgi:hypothetical protein
LALAVQAVVVTHLEMAQLDQIVFLQLLLVQVAVEVELMEVLVVMAVQAVVVQAAQRVVLQLLVKVIMAVLVLVELQLLNQVVVAAVLVQLVVRRLLHYRAMVVMALHHL